MNKKYSKEKLRKSLTSTKIKTPLPPETPTPSKISSNFTKGDILKEQAVTNKWKNISKQKEKLLLK